MRLDPVWRPLLLIGGAHPANSYAELEGEALRLHFGVLFHETLQVAELVSAERSNWPIISGIGWRTNFGRRIGLIGSQGGVVRLALSDRREMHLRPFPWAMRIDDIRISMEEPDDFIAAVNAAIARRSA